MRRFPLLFLLLFLLIALVILAPITLRPTDLIYPVSGGFTDLTITHWPAFAYTRDQLASTGQLPLWRTSILSGTPLAEDPLSGLLYPPHWLAFIPGLPLSLVFNLLMLLHLALAAGAMAVLMRRWGVSRVAAMASAIAYAAAPKIIAHMGVGHVTLVEAWAWLPLVIAGLSPSPDDMLFVVGRGGRGVGAAIPLALCLLADARMAVYAAVLAATYVLVLGMRRDRSTWLKLTSRLVVMIMVALALSAAAWLPALSLTSTTTRSSLSPDEAATLSLDPVYVLGVLIADRSGAAERMTYVGLIVLVLAVIGVKLAYRSHRRRIIWLCGLLIAGVIVALGVNTPLYSLLSQLPGVSLLRVPARAWFVVTLAMAALAGLGLQGLLDWSGRPQRRSMVGLIGGAFFAFTFGLLGGFASRSISLIAIAVWLPLAVVLVILRLKHRLSAKRLALLMFASMSIDLLSVDWLLYRPVTIEQALADGREAAAWLAAQPGSFRVYSPSYSIPQQVAQAHHLQLADGIDPLQLSRYVAYMQRASGVGAWGYSVALPAFPNVKSDEEIRTALSKVLPDAALLGLLNVKYIVAAFPISQLDLIERARFGSTIVYENVRVMPRALVVGKIEAAANADAARQWLMDRSTSDSAVVEGLPASIDYVIQPYEASIVSTQADRVEVRASGPGLLVLSEVYAPDWQAQVDGAVTAIYPADLTLRGVLLPPGDHTIVMTYQPQRLYLGVLISVLSVLACATAFGIRRIRDGAKKHRYTN